MCQRTSKGDPGSLTVFAAGLINSSVSLGYSWISWALFPQHPSGPWQVFWIWCGQSLSGIAVWDI